MQKREKILISADENKYCSEKGGGVGVDLPNGETGLSGNFKYPNAHLRSRELINDKGPLEELPFVEEFLEAEEEEDDGACWLGNTILEATSR